MLDYQKSQMFCKNNQCNSVLSTYGNKLLSNLHKCDASKLLHNILNNLHFLCKDFYQFMENKIEVIEENLIKCSQCNAPSQTLKPKSMMVLEVDVNNGDTLQTAIDNKYLKTPVPGSHCKCNSQYNKIKLPKFKTEYTILISTKIFGQSKLEISRVLHFSQPHYSAESAATRQTKQSSLRAPYTLHGFTSFTALCCRLPAGSKLN